MKAHLFFILFTNFSWIVRAQSNEIWSVNDTLKIIHYSEMPEVIFKMFEGIEVPLDPLSENRFGKKIHIPDLDSAIFQYYFSGSAERIASFPENIAIWEGEKADVLDISESSDTTLILDTTIQSNFLSQGRTISIYCPTTCKGNDCPLIFMMDGAATNGFAKGIQQLVASKKIKPVILIGVHAHLDQKEIHGRNHSYRYLEYVDNGFDDTAFHHHQQFFLEEVIPIASEITGSHISEKYLYGFSNGAAFCVQTALHYPDLFEEIIAFSTVDYITEFKKPLPFLFDSYPNFYVAAGRYERSFEDSKRFVSKLDVQNINYTFKELICGHDYYAWRQAFWEWCIMRFGI